eukprot:1149801-Pelagomonas_calceolata.AAC.13
MAKISPSDNIQGLKPAREPYQTTLTCAQACNRFTRPQTGREIHARTNMQRDPCTRTSMQTDSHVHKHADSWLSHRQPFRGLQIWHTRRSKAMA